MLKSLEDQTSKYELILVDNAQGKYKLAAEALNWGGARAEGKYVMFLHQDVCLCSNSWLEDAEKILQSLPELGIAGVAGMSDKGNSNRERGRNIIAQGEPATMWPWGNPIQEPEKVQTLDECLIIIPRPVFDVLQFDEEVCDGWHLYVVDYCLSVAKLGLGVYVLPMFLYHRSGGSILKNRLQIIVSLGPLPKEYYRTLRKILKKHKANYKLIYSTCGDWSTSYPLILQRIWFLVKGGLRLLASKFQRESQKE